jgi:hypothetical protein
MARSPIEQPGLRLRIGSEGRRISSQHRQLDSIYAQVAAAAGRGSLEETRRALQRFRDAWEAHTSLEDGFYFPALRGLRPELGVELEALSAEHGRFREAFDGLDAQLAARDLPGLGAALERFAEAIAGHEEREETLVAELTRSAAG